MILIREIKAENHKFFLLLIAVLILLQPLVEYSVRMVPNHTGHSDAESQMQAS